MADLSPEYEYLAESLPREIMGFASICPDHVLSEEEKLSFYKKNYLDEIKELRKEIAELRSERDNLLFSSSENEDKYNDLTGKIEEKEVELSGIEEKSPDGEKVLLALSLTEENKKNELLDEILGGPEFREADKLDYLVWGSLEEIEGADISLLRSFQLHRRKGGFLQGDGISSREFGKGNG